MPRVHPTADEIAGAIALVPPSEDPLLRQETEEWKRFQDVVKSKLGVARSPEDDNLIRIVRTLCKAYAMIDEKQYQHLNVSELVDALTSGRTLDVTNILVRQRANAREPGTGKTLLHLATYACSLPLVILLLDCGAEIDSRDAWGRTPLHYAASRGSSPVIDVLLKRGASYTALTNEGQTAVHYAARYDAEKALAQILAFVTVREPSSSTSLANAGRDKAPQNADDLSAAAHKLLHQKDVKGRSPLHVATLYDRSVTARYLLLLGSDASEPDGLGVTPLEIMIDKMPSVAKQALGSEAYVTIDRAGRKMRLDLAAVEPPPPETTAQAARQSSPLEQMIVQNRLELIDMPVVQRLVYHKWQDFGRQRMLLEVAYYIVYLTLWTTVALAAPEAQRHEYLHGHEWRIIVELAALLMWAYNIYVEVLELWRSYSQHREWVRLTTSELSEEQAGCDPEWPDYEYLKEEMEAVKNKGVLGSYVSNAWNYFDWLSYLTIFASLVANINNVLTQDEKSARQNVRWMTIALIFMWAKLLKLARAFETFGPFVVMLGQIVWNVVEFVFLYITLIVPFVVGFYLVVGDSAVDDFGTVYIALMSTYRMTFVDYDFDEIYAADPVMGPILVAAWLFISGTLMINLFVAMMSNTFQIVYDNAKSVAAMQHADAVLSVQFVLPLERLRAHRRRIQTECNPDIITYDEDDGDADSASDQLKNLREEVYGLVVAQSEKIAEMSRQIDDLKSILLMAMPLQPGAGVGMDSPQAQSQAAGHAQYSPRPSLPSSPAVRADDQGFPFMAGAQGRGNQLPPLQLPHQPHPPDPR